MGERVNGADNGMMTGIGGCGDSGLNSGDGWIQLALAPVASNGFRFGFGYRYGRGFSFVHGFRFGYG
jgi:hypothetical protein